MSHFAKVNAQGIVTDVIVAEQDFIDSLPDSDLWIKTSYNTRGGKHYDPITGNESADQSKALRKNFAGRGYSYDSVRDAFIPPKEFASWLLNETTCLWEAPVTYPSDNQSYVWVEEIHNANTSLGWVQIDTYI